MNQKQTLVSGLTTFFARNRLAVIALCGLIGIVIAHQMMSVAKTYVSSLPVTQTATVLTGKGDAGQRSDLNQTKRIAAIFAQSKGHGALGEVSDDQAARLFSVKAPIVPEAQITEVKAPPPPAEKDLRDISAMIVVQAVSPTGATMNDQFVSPGTLLNFLPPITLGGKARYPVLEKITEAGHVVVVDPQTKARVSIGSQQ